MIKFLSGLFIGLLVAQASASGKCSGATGGGVGTTWCEDNNTSLKGDGGVGAIESKTSPSNKLEVRGNAAVVAGRTPSGKPSIIQVDEDGYVIVRKR